MMIHMSLHWNLSHISSKNQLLFLLQFQNFHYEYIFFEQCLLRFTTSLVLLPMRLLASSVTVSAFLTAATYEQYFPLRWCCAAVGAYCCVFLFPRQYSSLWNTSHALEVRDREQWGERSSSHKWSEEFPLRICRESTEVSTFTTAAHWVVSQGDGERSFSIDNVLARRFVAPGATSLGKHREKVLPGDDLFPLRLDLHHLPIYSQVRNFLTQFFQQNIGQRKETYVKKDGM